MVDISVALVLSNFCLPMFLYFLIVFAHSYFITMTSSRCFFNSLTIILESSSHFDSSKILESNNANDEVSSHEVDFSSNAIFFAQQMLYVVYVSLMLIIEFR